jgi:hypothetical protein
MIYTDEITNIDRDIRVPIKDILVLEDGVIKTTSGQIISIAIGGTSGLDVETMYSDNEIIIPNSELNISTTYSFIQETGENNWGECRIIANMNVASTVHKNRLNVKVRMYDGNNEIIDEKNLLPLEYDAQLNRLIFQTFVYPYPGFKKISFNFLDATEVAYVSIFKADLFKFARTTPVDNLIFKSYYLDPIVIMPGQAWYNLTEKVYKYTSLDEDNNVIVKVLQDGQDPDKIASDLIWLSVL